MNHTPELMKLDGFNTMKGEIERIVNRKDGTILSTGRQVHMLCTTVGLLVFIPKPNDLTYIASQVNYMAGSKTHTPNEVPSSGKSFGHFERYVLINVDEIKPILQVAHDTYGRNFQMIRDAVRNNKMFYNMVQESRNINFMRLTRQIRFICTGMILYGERPSIRMFQFMYTIVSFDVLTFGRYYEDEDKNFYNSMTDLILEDDELALDGVSYVFPSVIDVYGYKRYNVQSKGATLLLPEGIRRSAKIKNAPRNINTIINDDFKPSGVGLKRVITRSSHVNNITNSYSHESRVSVEISGGNLNDDVSDEFSKLGRAATNLALNDNPKPVVNSLVGSSDDDW